MQTCKDSANHLLQFAIHRLQCTVHTLHRVDTFLLVLRTVLCAGVGIVLCGLDAYCGGGHTLPALHRNHMRLQLSVEALLCAFTLLHS